MTDPAALAEVVGKAPCLPSLGPIHPDEDAAAIWSELLATTEAGEYLPYDKDRVWGGRKTARILTKAIVDSDAYVLIPVLNQRGAGTVDLYCYGNLERARRTGGDVGAKLAADHGVARARLVWFGKLPDRHAQRTVRVQLKTFVRGSNSCTDSEHVAVCVEQPPASASGFRAFAVNAGEGFPFLAERIDQGIDDGPVLTVKDSMKVVGAIGPMRTLPDSRGRLRLLGQYFAVLPEFRARGFGRALWRAAMRWGSANDAAYQLLQTELDSPSDRICRADGLSDLGLMHTRVLALLIIGFPVLSEPRGLLVCLCRW
ncbi:GNAT family N-acetyltransferase [Glycomyces artemisiae]|uniref:N-acetyltransferase domain-containing protein n=1 Tax=Glycomyces artemisiae TaxID=1076443 RepID=A0A2T0UDQ6_9ACTN|nr:GNAT family N-acetyltransferase [Glycomyces artemisiae]PRY56014.1 hypothetical protein B0I28_111120 [Glycomyces artemisiae]